MVKIVIESTGCDKGFDEVLEGAKKAVEQNSDLESIILVAGRDKLPEKYCLTGNYHFPKRISLEIAERTYHPKDSKKEQFQSSVYRVMELQKQKKVDASISPGDTRGTINASMRVLGLIEDILAPAIPTHWPFNNVLIDSGANPEPTPENLLQSAIMGYVYSKYFIRVKNPLIGIITNGTERSKGNRFIRESRRLIESRLVDYNLSGEYFEGNCVKDLSAGQVRVTDGHTGNIILKSSEGCLVTMFTYLYDKIKKQSLSKKLAAKYTLSSPVKEMKKELNYETYATGPLLGVNGNVMICHGRSDAEAIKNSIIITKKYLDCNINERLKEEILKYGLINNGNL